MQTEFEVPSMNLIAATLEEHLPATQFQRTDMETLEPHRSLTFDTALIENSEQFNVLMESPTHLNLK